MLSSILNVPSTKLEWDRWSFNHKTQHEAIRQAIQTQKGIVLSDYLIDPINFDHFEDFLINNQSYHNDMNAALGVQGNDFEGLDLQDEQGTREWIWQHYLDHQDANAALKI